MNSSARIPFDDRADAGRVLASMLQKFRANPDALILALPRGGVPVAFEVARQLGLPLDLLIVRKLGVPGQEELAFGAVASGNLMVLNRDVIRELHIQPDVVDEITQRELARVELYERALRGERPAAVLQGRTAILVDDGLATGASMRAAIQAVRAQHASTIVVAVPVAPAENCAQLEQEADEVICAATPSRFTSVGSFYRHFDQTTDEEVRDLLERARLIASKSQAHTPLE